MWGQYVKSKCLTPFSTKSSLLYVTVFNLITEETPRRLKIGRQSFGVKYTIPCQSFFFDEGELNATNLPGMTQFRSPFYTFQQWSYSVTLNFLKSNHPNFIAYSNPLRQSKIVHQYVHAPQLASRKGTNSNFENGFQASSAVLLLRIIYMIQVRYLRATNQKGSISILFELCGSLMIKYVILKFFFLHNLLNLRSVLPDFG